MFDSSNIICGLEIGTSKISAAVGDVNGEGVLNIAGVGHAKSRGVRKGEIVDAGLVGEDIRQAVAEAEQAADVEIRSVYLGVSGGHIRGLNNRGVHPVVSADREISEDDIGDVVKNAKAINLPTENTVLHAVRQHFYVDGQAGVKDPKGMLGARLELDMHVVHGNLNRLQNAVRAVKGIQLDVEEVVFNGLATSLALLTSEQKELGALVIDIGAGTTDYVVYSGGVIRHSGVLAVGGDHVTNDLAYGLKVPQSRAEQLKLEHGAACACDSVKGQFIEIKSELGLPLNSVSLEHLRCIMAMRLQEIFELVAEDVAEAELMEYLRAGVFITGGVSRTRDVAALASQVFGMPATFGCVTGMSGNKGTIEMPEHATAIGLVKFGSFKVRKREVRPGLLSSFKGVVGRFLTKH